MGVGHVERPGDDDAAALRDELLAFAGQGRGEFDFVLGAFLGRITVSPTAECSRGRYRDIV